MISRMSSLININIKIKNNKFILNYTQINSDYAKKEAKKLYDKLNKIKELNLEGLVK